MDQDDARRQRRGHYGRGQGPGLGSRLDDAQARLGLADGGQGRAEHGVEQLRDGGSRARGHLGKAQIGEPLVADAVFIPRLETLHREQIAALTVGVETHGAGGGVLGVADGEAASDGLLEPAQLAPGVVPVAVFPVRLEARRETADQGQGVVQRQEVLELLGCVLAAVGEG